MDRALANRIAARHPCRARQRILARTGAFDDGGNRGAAHREPLSREQIDSPSSGGMVHEELVAVIAGRCDIHKGWRPIAPVMLLRLYPA